VTPTGDFLEEIETMRREIEARRGPEDALPPLPTEAVQGTLREQHHRAFAHTVQTLEKVLDTLGCRAALAALRDSKLTGGYVEGPLAVRQDYIAAPNGPLYPPCAAVILRKPA
jgi:hypothetical protein